MKKIYFTVILLVSGYAGFSQTGKGSWLLGGNIEFASTSTDSGPNGNSTTAFAMNPRIGFFPVKNFAVILNANYASLSFKEDGFGGSSDYSLTIGPLLRYYLPASEKVKFFVGAGVGFGSGSSMTSTEYQFEAGPSFFITKAVALEFNLNYQTSTMKNKMYNVDMKQSQFGMGIGFMVYLGK